MTTPASMLSAPEGLWLIAVIGSDGCAAVLDDSAPPVALSAGSVLMVSPDNALRLVWGRTCGWTAWSVDVSLLQRAASRAGLGHLAGLPVAAIWERAAVRNFVAALVAESGAALSSGLSGRAMTRVRAYIDEHVDQRMSLGELARVAGISRFHFARQFRRRTGRSPMDYINRVRIERAKQMLSARDTRVLDVALALGFSDQSHFARTFRRMVGTAPSAFAGGYRQSA